MGKKTTEDKNTKEFNAEVCQLKHEAIDKEFAHSRGTHEEIKKMINDLSESLEASMESNYENLKDKVVLTEKTIGDKIDSLNDFDNSLKGNGNPGVWESIRWATWKIRILGIILLVLLILMLGGNFKGVTIDKIKETFGIKKTETKQTEFVIKSEEKKEEVNEP